MAVIKKISELTAKGSNIGANDLVIVGVSNGIDYDLKSVTGNQLVGAAVAQTITNGVTTTAPSQDAVFDALALKVDTVVGSRLITSAESTLIGNTSNVNTGDETLNTIKTKLGVTTLSGTNTGDQDLSGYQLTSGKDASSGYVGISAGNVITLPLGRGFVSNNVTPNQIAHFDASGNLLTLSVATYPSISELSYVKGVTSAIQTQINAKVTGSGTSSGTNTGDQIISDATITTTDITTNNFTTAKHGFVPKGTNVGNYLKDDGTWGAISAGGLTYFTEAQNTTAPNATVPVDSLTAVTGTTNGDFAILPKGTGAILSAIPDGTATGGSKRGAYAIDFQRVRSGSLYVAAASYSTIIGGSNHYIELNDTATIIAGGTSNQTYNTATNCAILGGTSSIIAGGTSSFIISSYSGITAASYSAIIGGTGNGITGNNSVIAGGNNNNISGTVSFACGSYQSISGNNNFSAGQYHNNSGSFNACFGVYGASFSHSSRFVLSDRNVADAQGGSQKSNFITTAFTTSATPVSFTTYNGTAIALVLQNNNSIRFKGMIVARQSGSVNTCAWDFDGIIQRGANAASTTLLISNVNLVQNTPAWGTPTLTADTTNGGLSIKAVGIAATNIKWVATFETVEVIYA